VVEYAAALGQGRSPVANWNRQEISMRRASEGLASWGLAASSLLLAGLTTAVLATPAAAQTAPSPAPGLGDLLPNLLQPLAPIVSQPNPLLPAVGGGSSGSQPGTGSHQGGAGAASANSDTIPANIEAKCGPTPAPLVFNRTPPRNSQDLENAAAKIVGPGGNIAAEMLKIAAPFPIAGSFHYRDDWGDARVTPCPHLHQGNDIFAPAGTPAIAPENGVLVRFASEAVGGNAYYFAGDDGYKFYGAHLASFNTAISVGQHVGAGTILGYVGSTGDAAGGASHLHFQLYAPGAGWGTPEDPKAWLDAALTTAIRNAGGVVTDGSNAVGTNAASQTLDVGSLMSSVLNDGGHIISQPTVPVVLLVVLVLGVLLGTQSRTFKVAADLRRSRNTAALPSFVVGSMGAASATEDRSRRRRHRRGRSLAGNGDAQDPGHVPPWAVAPEAPKPAKSTPSRIARARRSMGGRLERLPTTMNRALAPRPANGSKDPRNANGSKDPRNANGSKDPRNAGDTMRFSSSFSPGRATSTSVMERAGKSSGPAKTSGSGSPAGGSNRSGSRFSKSP
jgi:murein DD-endopeptidase MepM/ murein hydrolase activator NlpD